MEPEKSLTFSFLIISLFAALAKKQTQNGRINMHNFRYESLTLAVVTCKAAFQRQQMKKQFFFLLQFHSAVRLLWMDG